MAARQPRQTDRRVRAGNQSVSQCLRARLRACNVRTWSSLVSAEARACNNSRSKVAMERQSISLYMAPRQQSVHCTTRNAALIRHPGVLPFCERAHRSGLQGSRARISVAALSWSD